MKKILLATTMLVGTAGFAAAEITMSGSAVMGVGDNGTDTVSKMETYLTFSASGESDSGISFGFDQTIATYDTDGGLNDDGTSVYISGAFGKLSMGSVAEADEVATLSDIGGIGGLGVDNVAEAFSGDSAGRQTHDVNYSYSAGDFSIAASTRIGATGDGDSYAVGAKYTFGEMYVGLGYNDDNATPVVAGTVTSLYAGGTAGAVSVAAMYSSWDADSGAEADAWGVTTSYTAGALTLSAAYSDNDNVADAAFGVGAAYDLGGGASVVGGVADLGVDTVWEAGVSLSF